jgi:hypothetical protein
MARQLIGVLLRNNQPVELSGRYEPQMTERPPREVFDRTMLFGAELHLTLR